MNLAMTNAQPQEWQVEDVAAMHDFAAQWSADLRGGEILALCGSLGAGKTHFTQGLARGLGIDPQSVTSPTFTLIHEYTGGRLPLYHFDFYRLESEQELLGVGWEEYLDEPGVVVAEWADKFPHLLPASTQWWRISADEQRPSVRTLRLGKFNFEERQEA